MRIALITDYPVQEIGGVQSYCYHLIKEVNSRDNSILFDPINISNIKYTYIKKLNLFRFSKKELRKRIEVCDLVHINTLASYPSMQAIDIAVDFGKKIICTSHYHPAYALSRPFFGELFYKIIVSRRLKHIDYLVTINKEEYALLHTKVKQCSIIPHWINSDLQSFSERPVSLKRRDKAIVFVGKVNQKHKRADFLLEVNEDVEVRYVSKVKMTSGKSNLKQYQNLSNKELTDLYRKARCVVVPSKYEAFSYVSLESLLCGTPILISDRVRIADFLEDNKLVSVFEYGNKKDFQNKLNQVFHDDMTDEIVGKCVEKVRDIFNVDKIIGEYINLYYRIGSK